MLCAECSLLLLSNVFGARGLLSRNLVHQMLITSVVLCFPALSCTLKFFLLENSAKIVLIYIFGYDLTEIVVDKNLQKKKQKNLNKCNMLQLKMLQRCFLILKICLAHVVCGGQWTFFVVFVLTQWGIDSDAGCPRNMV